MSPDTRANTAGYEDTRDEESEHGARMSFLEHLDELRKRIIYALIALVVACSVAFYFNAQMYEYLTAYFSVNVIPAIPA
jgi:sec-independent protein translocase protein TatC